MVILREGFEKYRETWLAQYPELEPLTFLTFPSYNNAVFRYYYMPAKSLGLLPPQGYDNGNSVKAMGWIFYMAQRMGLSNVRTARKGYEVFVGGEKVDGCGVDERGGHHVFEFHGCLWHGHDCSANWFRGRPHSVWKLKRTLNRDAKLYALQNDPKSPCSAFTYHRIWECEWDAMAKGDPTIRVYKDLYLDLFPNEPLRPRDALRGGRTNAIRHYIPQLPEGDSIYYYDFTRYLELLEKFS